MGRRRGLRVVGDAAVAAASYRVEGRRPPLVGGEDLPISLHRRRRFQGCPASPSGVPGPSAQTRRKERR
jgi:hypothetical protein